MDARQKFRDAFQKKFKKSDVDVEITSANTVKDVVAYPSGILSFDVASGCGGWPQGRLVEVFGPESGGKSLLSLISVAYDQQRTKQPSLYFDLEGGTPREWLETIGIDLELFDIVPAGLNAGQILDAIVLAIQEGNYRYIIVDSVAGMVPRAELEGDIDKHYMSELARTLSQGIRKIVQTLSSTPNSPCVIMINQIREKPGIMFGCFQYDARVVLANGTTKRIGEIVNNRLPVEVLSYDARKRKIVPRKVIDWHKNGAATEFLKITVEDYAKVGKRTFLCTPDHEIRTENGFRAAKTLKSNDRVYTNIEKVLSNDQREFIIGSILGDGALLSNRHKYTGIYHEKRDITQIDYLHWKYDLLKPLITQFKISPTKVSMNSKSLFEFGELYNKIYQNGQKVFTSEIGKMLNWLGIAAWYLDAGTFYKTGHGSYNAELCLQGFDNKSISEICKFFKERLGEAPHRLSKIRAIRFCATACNKLFTHIQNYVCPCMQYKLSESFRGQFITPNTLLSNPRRELELVKIITVEKAMKKSSMQRFDITVEDTSNYFIGNINVHNSPETTPGGRALKFYSSQRYRVSKKSQSEKTSAGDVIGHVVKIVNKKNKLGPPQRESEFFINYTEGVDTVGTIFAMIKDQNLYEKKGQKYALTVVDTNGKSIIEFDKVKDIKDKLATDPAFQEQMYRQCIGKHIGTYKTKSIADLTSEKVEEFDDEFQKDFVKSAENAKKQNE